MSLQIHTIANTVNCDELTSTVLLFVQTRRHIHLSTVDIDYFRELDIDCFLYLRASTDNSLIHSQVGSKLSVRTYTDSYFMFSASVIERLRPYTKVIYIDSSIGSIRSYLTPELLATSFNMMKLHPVYDQITFTPSTDAQVKLKNCCATASTAFVPCYTNTYTSDDAESDLFLQLSDHNNIFTSSYVAYMKRRTVPRENISKTLSLITHSNYINHKYTQFNFKLQLSVFNVAAVFPVDSSAISPQLIINNHFEDVYAKYLELRGFISENIHIDQIPLPKNERRRLADKPVFKMNPTPSTNPSENVTIVTAFIDLKITRPPKKNIKPYDYFDQSKQTLSIRQNMVIFVSESMVDKVYNFRQSLGLKSKTKIIEVNARDHLYMLDQLPRIASNIDKNVPPYNIPKYIMAVNSRYNLIKQAIDMNVFDSDYFAWVDFSAGHVVDIPPDTLIRYNNDQQIRISWIGRMSGTGESTNPFYFKYNYKCCGGGVFVGHKYMMTELIRIHHEEFVRLMDAGYCINDDKLLFIIFEKYPRLFDMYVTGYKNLMTKL